jgi:hypothetical protein
MKTLGMTPYVSQDGMSNLGLRAAAWLAVHDPGLTTSPVSSSLLTHVIRSGQVDDLLDAWQRLGAFQSLRAFGRQKGLYFRQRAQEALPRLTVQDGEIWWHDFRVGNAIFLGTDEWLFQQAFPQESQVQIAYDTFCARFLAWLERHSQIIVLESGGATLLFQPDGVVLLDLADAWQRFLTFAFSTSELQRTFVLLLNSIRLSERGVSVPDIPFVTMDQVDLLIAFFTATLQAITRRLNQMKYERQTLLRIAHGANSRELTPKEKTTQKNLDERLALQHERYDPALTRLEHILTQLQHDDQARAERIRTLARSYTTRATWQLKMTRDVMNKTVARIEELLVLSPKQLFCPPALLLREVPMDEMRAPSDFTNEVCYTCGNRIPSPLKKGKRVMYTANKLILPAPSQTLQSRLGQVEPFVCATCALLALASPIKMIQNGLVITLREWHGQQPARYLYEHQLRMLTTGELNIAAGRYLMIPCTEQAPDTKPLIQRLGGKEYALLKVSSLFPVDVLIRFQVEAFFGTDPVVLKQRHLLILRFFVEAFAIQLAAFRDKTSRPRYAALADAVRSVEHDHVVFALYQLVVGFQQQGTFSTVQRTLLEDGLVAYKEQLVMDGEVQLEQRFRDIAGLTGVLYAFVSLAKSKLSPASSGGNETLAIDSTQRDRELKKLLEEVDNPNHFTYEAASTILGQTAQLWRSQQSYFIYDEAKRLLQEVALVEISERETRSEKGELVLKLCYDDICKLYAALYEKRYLTEAARRAFTYELKLSLYSRFPELRPGKQNT